MARYNFSVNLAGLKDSPALKEATAEEVRVLLALASLEGSADGDTLSQISGVSSARVASAVSYWQEYGALNPGGKITEEFEERMYPGEILEEDARTVARGIRDNSLKEVIEEFARLMNKNSASSMEVKRITALSTQYGLSAEYIALYMAHLHERGALTSAARLTSGAIKLSEGGITTAEELGIYLAEWEKKKNEFFEIKKLLGIYGRKLSKSEESYFSRWTADFEYDIPIIGEAYDITAINTGKASLPYMDKLLSDWHSAGAKTLEECRKRYDSEKLLRDEKSSAGASKKQAPKKPRYGDFDPDEALAEALKRSSFSDDNDSE